MFWLALGSPVSQSSRQYCQQQSVVLFSFWEDEWKLKMGGNCQEELIYQIRKWTWRANGIVFNKDCTVPRGGHVRFAPRPLHGSYKWIIMLEKCGRPDINVFHIKRTIGNHGNLKIKILGAVLELPARQQCQSSPFTSKIGPNGLNWQCCLAGSSKTAPRILIFSMAMGAKPSF